MVRLWLKLFQDCRRALLLTMVLLFCFQLFWVLVTKRVITEFSPLFRGIANRLQVQEEMFQKHFFSGPGKIMQSILGGENIRFNRVQDTLVVGYLHPLVQIIFCLWAIGRASGAIAGEIDKGTMELLLAQPISRSKIILAHLGIDLLALPLLAVTVWLGTFVGILLVGPFEVKESHFEMFNIVIPSEAFQIKVDPQSLAPSVWNIMAFLFALSGLTIFFSAMGRFRNRVIGLVVFLVLIQFIINVLGQLWQPLEMLRPLTLFYYYQPQLISLYHHWYVDPGQIWLKHGLVSLHLVWTLIGIGSLGYLLAWWQFSRRDVPAPL